MRSGFVPDASNGLGVGVDTPATVRTRWDVVGRALAARRHDHAYRAAGPRTRRGGEPASWSPVRCMTPAGPESSFPRALPWVEG